MGVTGKTTTGGLQQPNTNNIVGVSGYRNFETTSSLSKGSSANNTPSKYANYGSGFYKKQQQNSSSLKKVKSVSQFHKTSNLKEQQ